MARKALLVAIGLAAIASPALAANPDPVPAEPPAGTPETLYCMRVEPETGSRVEAIHCWTRAQWAEQEVDVDRDWAREGVRVIG
ncbi:hypothetical protein LZ518_00670 [Sphingomonas sp. RB56-2]|jgi:hypothetical protein|uniref:Secreted protein n=1 Tax=Sphingomonas brevis TaxID=2908206 RepID=A0ABT0S684_9SPHN|nr:hypothetical protein [Sphingomonas brevis]MCL6739657.1 hypothetical protein [Sphingomonas brevis]